MPGVLPKTIKVGPHEYTIQRTAAASLPEKLGDCDVDALVLRIRQRLRKSKAREIVLHEALHACGHPAFEDGKRYTEEDFITKLAPKLLQLLRDNPALVAYLLQA